MKNLIDQSSITLNRQVLYHSVWDEVKVDVFLFVVIKFWDAPPSVAQCLSCLGDSSTHTGSTDSGEKPRIHTGKSRSKTRNANRQVGDFFLKNSAVKWTVSLVVWSLLLIHYKYKLTIEPGKCLWFRRLWIFSVIFYYTCARLVARV